MKKSKKMGTKIIALNMVLILILGLFPAVVSANPVDPVVITPGAITLPVGASLPLSATGGLGGTVTWTSDNTSVATVAGGVVTAVGVGSAIITAEIDGEIGSATVTVTAAPVVITPAGPVTLAVGATQSFSATGGSGGTVTWSSNAEAIATVNLAGVVTAVSAGSATITANIGGETNTVTVNVTAVAPTSLTVNAANNAATVLRGGTLQFSVAVLPTGAAQTVTWTLENNTVNASIDANGLLTVPAGATLGASVTIRATSTANTSVTGTRNVTIAAPVVIAPAGDFNLNIGAHRDLTATGGSNAATAATAWGSSNQAVATVNASGRVTAVAAGTATITATRGALNANVTVTVAAAGGFVITGTGVSNNELSLLAGQTRQLNIPSGTGTTTWESSDTDVATVSNAGLVTALTPGTSTITVTRGNNAASITLTVTGIAITPVGDFGLNAGQTRQLSVAGGSGAITWTSSHTNIATVSANGLVTAVANGTATITANRDGYNATITVTVGGLSITPAGNFSMSPNQTHQLSVTGGSGTTTWSSDNTGVATVSTNGTITAVSNGTATITATRSGITSTVRVTVGALSIAPIGSFSLNPGQTRQLSVTGGSGTTTWSSSNTNIAAVSTAGLVTAVAPGTSTITVTRGNNTAYVTVTVTGIGITPAGNFSLITGQTRQLSVTGGTGTTTWTSSNANVATVNSNGLVTAVNAGTSTITATRGGQTASVTATVTAPTPATVPNLNQASYWAQSFITRAFNLNLLPTQLQYGYTRAITRAEFTALATALYEGQRGPITGRVTFNDTSDVNVQKMAYVGVVLGVAPGQFAPNDQITREQAATMLSRLAYALGNPLQSAAVGFADSAAISYWAREAVGQMQATGVMLGVGNNEFAPRDMYTREQSVITILRMYDLMN